MKFGIIEVSGSLVVVGVGEALGGWKFFWGVLLVVFFVISLNELDFI